MAVDDDSLRRQIAVACRRVAGDVVAGRFRRGDGFCVVLAHLRSFRWFDAGGVAAIVLVCVLEQPLPYRLLVIAGGIYVRLPLRPRFASSRGNGRLSL